MSGCDRSVDCPASLTAAISNALSLSSPSVSSAAKRMQRGAGLGGRDGYRRAFLIGPSSVERLIDVVKQGRECGARYRETLCCLGDSQPEEFRTLAANEWSRKGSVVRASVSALELGDFGWFDRSAVHAAFGVRR